MDSRSNLISKLVEQSIGMLGGREGYLLELI